MKGLFQKSIWSEIYFRSCCQICPKVVEQGDLLILNWWINNFFHENCRDVSNDWTARFYWRKQTKTFHLDILTFRIEFYRGLDDLLEWWRLGPFWSIILYRRMIDLVSWYLCLFGFDVKWSEIWFRTKWNDIWISI